MLALLIPLGVYSQGRFEFGVHLTPQLRYVNSRDIDFPNGPPDEFTVGGSGVAAGYSVGGYIEYHFGGGWYARTGVDFSRKRHHYRVERVSANNPTPEAGRNRIVYNALEVPVSVLYRFGYDYGSKGRFLVGVGGTVNRWYGDPQLDNDFFTEGEVRPPFKYVRQSLMVFAGYDRTVTSRLLIGVEPYLSYTPTTFELETASVARVALEAGITLRLRFDN